MRKIHLLAIGLVVGALWGTGAFAAAELAKVNGRALTDKDLQQALGNLNEGQRNSFLRDVNSRREVLMKVIEQEILVQQAEKEKLDQDQAYKDALAMFRRQYLANRLLEKNLASKLTDKAVRKYYDTHKAAFSTDRAHVQHILLADEATARDVLKQVKAPNADFQELAEKLSKDPSAKNNRGDLGTVGRDSPFVEEFKNAVFAASEGDIVGPIKTAFGYHIIRIVEKNVGKPMEFDEVQLRAKGDFQRELVTGFVTQLKEKAKISVDEKALSKP